MTTVEFTPDLLKARLVERIQIINAVRPLVAESDAAGGAVTASPPDSRPDSPAAPSLPSPAASETHSEYGQEGAPPIAGEDSPSFSDPTVFPAHMQDEFHALAAGIEHVSLRFDKLYDTMQRQRGDAHRDLAYQRMKMVEIGADLVGRLSTVERAVVDHAHAIGSELRAHRERIAAELGSVTGEIERSRKEMQLAVETSVSGVVSRLEQVAVEIANVSRRFDAAEAALEARIDAIELELRRRDESLQRNLHAFDADDRRRQEDLRLQIETVGVRTNSGMEKLSADVREFGGRIASSQSDLLRHIDAYGVEVRVREEGIQSRLERADSRAAEGLANVQSTVCSKMDTYMAELVRRHEGIQSSLDLAGSQTAEGLAAVQSTVCSKMDTYMAELVRRDESIHSRLDLAGSQTAEGLAAVQSTVCSKMDTYTADLVRQHDGILSRLDHTGTQTAGGLAAVQGTVCSKMDTYMAELVRRHEGTFSAIRPPVLAGTDVLVVRVSGMVLAVPRQDWVVAAYYAFNENPEPGLLGYLRSVLRPGDVFVDIGANIGIFTVAAALAVRETGRVYSFEPDPRTFHVLRQNVRANGLQQVELFPLALLDRSGERPLYRVEGISTWNNLFAGDEDESALPVQVSTLDTVLRDVKRVDWIKIDAEGAEPFIWRGMKRILAANPRIRIITEFAPVHLRRAGADPEEFLHKITDAGLSISCIDEKTGSLSPFDPTGLAPRAGINLLLQRGEHP